MRSRLAARFAIDDQPTVHRWARTLTVVYSLSLVALVAFALVSYQFTRAPVKTASGVQAAVARP
jgi:hypothetical protein